MDYEYLIPLSAIWVQITCSLSETYKLIRKNKPFTTHDTTSYKEHITNYSIEVVSRVGVY
jgi:hypothetical protein